MWDLSLILVAVGRCVRVGAPSGGADRASAPSYGFWRSPMIRRACLPATALLVAFSMPVMAEDGDRGFVRPVRPVVAA